MLILKSNPNGLGVVEFFLRNRGWNLYCTSDLKDALSHLIKNKPYYVMISVDHANPNVLSLPQLLGPGYPGIVVPFAETHSARSFKSLNESIGEYKVSPPVTGPAIERCVNKYLKDLQANPEAGILARNSIARDNSTYSIKGDSVAIDPDTLMAIGGHPSEVYVDKGKLTGGHEHDKGSAGGIGSYDPNHDSKASQGVQIQNSGKGNRPAGSANQAKEQGQGRSRWEPQDKSDTVMSRGAQKSLDESSDRGDGRIDQKIQNHTNAACIVIESVRFAGYLVAVMGKDRRIDEEFIQSVKGKLYKFLVEHGETISHEEAMSLKIKQVDFEPWAIEYAEFLRKSVHKGDEVAMAFFPRAQAKTVLEESKNESMVKIGLDDLHGDRQVDFDLFMYLPTNNKYLLYTPKGGVFYDRQLDRLKKQGFTHMHIQKEAATEVPKYRAENYLNDLVDDFTEAAKDPKKAKVPA